MSADRPDEFDDPRPRRRPTDDWDDRDLRSDYGDEREPPAPPEWRPPPKSHGFGFWMAVLWTLLYFVVTQVVAGMVFGILIIGIALAPEIRKNGMDALQPDKLGQRSGEAASWREAYPQPARYGRGRRHKLSDLAPRLLSVAIVGGRQAADELTVCHGQ